MMEYYVICKRYMSKKDYAIDFWGKNSSGYAFDVNMAGLYSEDEITRFEDHHQYDQPVERSIVDALAVERVIDGSFIGKIVVNNRANRRKLAMKLNELRDHGTIWTRSCFLTPEEFLCRYEKVIKIGNQLAQRKPEQSNAEHQN